MEAARSLASSTDVYLDQYIYHGKDGLRDFVRGYPAALLCVPSRLDKAGLAQVPRYDVVFFISSESSLGFTRFFIKITRPSTVVHIIHNADEIEGVKKLLAMHPRTRLLALSPHVVSALKLRGFKADWWLAAWPAQPPPGASNECLGPGNSAASAPWGFVCQGRIDSRRRSYDSLWTDLQSTVNEVARAAGGTEQVLPPPMIKILGRSVSRERQMAVPEAVRHLVIRYVNSPYKKFHQHIACSCALLPLFADDSYYSFKFSSTVLLSLSTGTPILADERFLASYRFLDSRTVFLQPPVDSHSLVGVMQQVAAMDPTEHESRREALRALRTKLNTAARGYLQKLLARRATKAGAG